MAAASSFSRWTRALLIATATLAASCSLDSRFVVEVSPQLPPTKQTVSVLGALKDGRLDADYWKEAQPVAARQLGGCDALFGEPLLARNPELYDRLDQRAREDGVGDELLHSVEAQARGDLVLVAYRAGELPSAYKRKLPAKHQAYPSLAATHAGRGYHEKYPSRRPVDDDDPGLDLSLYFYSVTAHATVAQISLHYTGNSVDEATQLLGRKLEATFPDFRCAGWR